MKKSILLVGAFLIFFSAHVFAEGPKFHAGADLGFLISTISGGFGLTQFGIGGNFMVLDLFMKGFVLGGNK